MIAPICIACGEELTEFGGLLLSPPTPEGFCWKRHLCVECFKGVEDMFAMIRRANKLKPERL
jgi:hypothetical protein